MVRIALASAYDVDSFSPQIRQRLLVLIYIRYVPLTAMDTRCIDAHDRVRVHVCVCETFGLRHALHTCFVSMKLQT